MNVFIGFPERLGKYGAAKYLYRRLGIKLDLYSRNMYQTFDKFGVMRIDSRDGPIAVDKGGALLAITGLDWYENYRLGGKGENLVIVEELDFGFAKIYSLKRPGQTQNELIELPEPVRVISPYEYIAKKYMKERELEFCDFSGNRGKVECIRGKTEGFVAAGSADLAIDNVNSGKTAKETGGGLQILEWIMNSNAIVISTRKNKNKVKEVLII